MLLSPRKNGLTSLFKEVRVFKEVSASTLGKSVFGRLQALGKPLNVTSEFIWGSWWVLGGKPDHTDFDKQGLLRSPRHTETLHSSRKYSRPDNYYIINSSGVQKCNVIFYYFLRGRRM